jgi:hypothetical protein
MLSSNPGTDRGCGKNNGLHQWLWITLEYSFLFFDVTASLGVEKASCCIVYVPHNTTQHAQHEFQGSHFQTKFVSQE